MRHCFSVLTLLFVVPIGAYSQGDHSKAVEAIRDHYTKVTKEIERIESNKEAASGSELAVNELVVNKLNKSWPAVGNYSVVYRFYYKQFGEEPYPDSLVMIRKKAVSAAREHHEEWLFSDDGTLAFYFFKDEEGAEHRLYYSGEEVLSYVGKGDKLDLSARASKVREYIRLFFISIQ